MFISFSSSSLKKVRSSTGLFRELGPQPFHIFTAKFSCCKPGCSQKGRLLPNPEHEFYPGISLSTYRAMRQASFRRESDLPCSTVQSAEISRHWHRDRTDPGHLLLPPLRPSQRQPCMSCHTTVSCAVLRQWRIGLSMEIRAFKSPELSTTKLTLKQLISNIAFHPTLLVRSVSHWCRTQQ